MAQVSIARLVEQLHDLGVRREAVLLVHTSFKQVAGPAGTDEGGPLGLIAALRTAIGDAGTLVMPTMTDGTTVFDPGTTPTADMGITAELFWRQPGVQRSDHPGGSFAAIGPHAGEICRPQPLSPPHGPDSPVGRVYDLGGQVLLLGVTHGENTTLHLAEAMAQVPYSVAHPCVVVGQDGAPRTVLIEESDHCCRNFARAGEWLTERGLQRVGPVGQAAAILCESRDVVAVAMDRLAADPLSFLCAPGQRCEECDRARASLSRSRLSSGL